MNDLKHSDELLDPEKGFLTFEELKRENGQAYWLASEIMERLGYGDDMKSFYKAINRANKAMTGLNIDPFSNIEKTQTPDGKADYKLTRFASYLVIMNADTKKPEVGRAQAYFVAMTRQFEMLINEPEDVTRVAFRQEIKEQNRRLGGAAEHAGVVQFDRFHNAGYRGMYNMMNVELADRRGLQKDELLEHMGSTEMAANLFRIEMTKAQLERQGKIGQEKSEQVHRHVGQRVRDMVKESTGTNPEDLPVERRLTDINKQLKIGHKEMVKIDDDSLQQEKPVKRSVKKKKT